MIVSATNIVILVLIAICAWLSAKWLFQKDTEIENRRRAAGRLAASLKEMGFKELPEFFINYSVGDYSGMSYKLVTIAQKMMSGEKAILTELDDVFFKLLDIKLNTTEGRHLLTTKLANLEKQTAQTAAPTNSAATPAG